MVAGSVPSMTASTRRQDSVVRSDIKITDVKVYQREEGKDKAVFVKIETNKETALPCI